MTDKNHPKYDLAIIGTGIAGMAAAVFATNRGISTVIIGSLGETWFTSGLIDLMGIHPIREGKTWEDPWSAIDAVVREIPGHPYNRLAKEDIRAALKEFYAFLDDAGLPYCWRENRNSKVITALGNIKITHGVPATMWPGVTALSQKSSGLIVDIQGLKGFSARLIAERLRSDWPQLHTVSIPSLYDDPAHEAHPLPLARDLEIGKYRQRFADLIKPHIRDAEFVGIPAIFGVNQAQRVMREFADQVGKPVFEIPTMPPSIPGIRLKEAFLRSLPAKGVRCLFQKRVIKATQTPDGEFSLDIGKTDREAEIISKGVVLASGRFLGGGLLADRVNIKEAVFDLPIFQPERRENWHRDNFFEPCGHAINQAGIETDEMFRPLDTSLHPAFERLFAAGSILAHQDWVRMKCGSGLSLATAYGAVESFIKLQP